VYGRKQDIYKCYILFEYSKDMTTNLRTAGLGVEIWTKNFRGMLRIRQRQACDKYSIHTRREILCWI